MHKKIRGSSYVLRKRKQILFYIRHLSWCSCKCKAGDVLFGRSHPENLKRVCGYDNRYFIAVNQNTNGILQLIIWKQMPLQKRKTTKRQRKKYTKHIIDDARLSNINQIPYPRKLRGRKQASKTDPQCRTLYWIFKSDNTKF